VSIVNIRWLYGGDQEDDNDESDSDNEIDKQNLLEYVETGIDDCD